ncbi:hypothetical protein V3O24_12845 [Methylobacter sp. Wu8]|uniref:hypothetical protein n=1 Tax=Methylobacter sp. Wu8 TaxID=3118457 RepID=UPI002F33CD44
MGGYGSGRKFGADCTDDYRSLDVRRWQRDGYLVPGQKLDWQWLQNGKKIAAIDVKVEVGQVRLIYNYRRNGEDWENLDYPVKLQRRIQLRSAILVIMRHPSLVQEKRPHEVF